MKSLTSRGFSFVETIIAMLVLSIAGLAIVALINSTATNAQKIRKTQNCERLAESGFTKLKNIDFYYLFAVDSSTPGWATPTIPGMATPPLHTTTDPNAPPTYVAYPYFPVLTGILSSLQNYGFSRFTVGIVFMHRDASLTNLIPFVSNGATPPADAADPVNVKFFDETGDGDYFETYSDPATGRTIAEQPDTHIKQVTLNIYDNTNQLACSHTELISLEQLSGNVNQASSSALSLVVSTPTPNSYLYSLNACPIACPSPINPQLLPGLGASEVPAQTTNHLSYLPGYSGTEKANQLRADAIVPLTVGGQTAAQSNVDLYWNTQGPLDNYFIITGHLVPNTQGLIDPFSFPAATITSHLREGNNLIQAQSVKAPNFSSPFASVNVIYDVVPPQVSNLVPTPGSTVNTLAPCIQASASDLGVSTTVTSGIDPSVVAMGWSGVFQMNTQYAPRGPSSGTMTVAYPYYFSGSVPHAPPPPHTHIPPPNQSLSIGSPNLYLGNTIYNVVAQFGDYAGYISTAAWSFTIFVGTNDPGSPAITQFTQLGGHSCSMCPISAGLYDTGSGIDPQTISMIVDGVTVIPTGSLNISQFYNLCTGAFIYQPTTPLANGPHNVTITASNFVLTECALAGNCATFATCNGLPGGNVTGCTTTSSWPFSVP